MNKYKQEVEEVGDVFMFDNKQVEEWLAHEEESLDKIPSRIQDDMFDDERSQHYNNVQLTTNNRPILDNVELRPVDEIPSPYNSIFKFGVFNIIQSKCLNDAFYENNNLVISAPTGAGKTVLMELAIIRTLLNNGNNSKIIYMAPTKSLCSERARDWGNKFKPFGIECKEYTGDTIHSIKSIANTTIIVTTPEKWDSMTRRWIDHRQLMKLITLFLIDEVHILNEKRGACLEVCVSRMKTMDSNLRYIAVSATVPNLEDIATWLNAKPISFSEEYRPIRLERVVYGFPQYNEENMFQFDRKLDWKLLDMIQKHSNGKPVLIFCSTRKSAEQSCHTLLKLMAKKKLDTLSESSSRVEKTFKDKNLPKFVQKGIAFHHAGLDPSDRALVESMYANREIRIIATTSTLAVGVNLPAHLVILKSTQGYQNGGLSEYSDIDVLQMMGRAGRPGLDTSGSVVVLTTLSMENRYRSLVSGTTNLESRLHENLIEHLVSEISLGTIDDEKSAIKWLKSTFLNVRVMKAPIHYKLGSSLSSPDQILQEICFKDLELLEKSNLIEKTTNLQYKPTAYGLVMDRYYMKFSTICRILEHETPTSVKDTLELVCASQEEVDTIRFNSGDKPFLNNIKNNPNIRFPLEKVTCIPDKILLLVQCVLGDVSLYNNGGSSILAMEASTIMNHINRVTKCIIDCSVQEKNSTKLKFALELYQSIQAKLWSTSPYVARQIDGIGQNFAKALAQANLMTFNQLRECDPGRIEMILHRNPPFGTKFRKQIDAIPNFLLGIKEIPTRREQNKDMITLKVAIGLLNRNVIQGKNQKNYYAQFWVHTSDKEVVDFRRILISRLHVKQHEFSLQVQVKSSNFVIYCHLQSEDYVGVDVHKEIRADIDPKKYITVSGPSNLSNSETNKKKALQNDEFGNDLDTQTWDQLATTALTPPTTNDVNTSNTQPVSQVNTKRKPAVAVDQAKKPCKHNCKDKEKCAHKCCKRVLPTTKTCTSNNFISNRAMKRVNSDEEDDDNVSSISAKRLKMSNTGDNECNQIQPIPTQQYPMQVQQPIQEQQQPIQNKPSQTHPTQITQSTQHSSLMEIPDDFPELSEKEISELDLSYLRALENKAERPIKIEQEDMQIDFFDFDGDDLLMEEPVLPPCKDIKLNVLPHHDEQAFAEDYHLIQCDYLWDQAGELAQKAFDDYNKREKKRMICYQEEQDLPKKPEIKCTSLLKWIEDNVEIVYN